MPSVTKWNVVPPCILIGARAWWVSTNTAQWYGGSSPHQPFHSSSSHGPRIGPNMLRPMIEAPMPSKPRGHEVVVDALVAALFAGHLAPESGLEHPLVQLLAAAHRADCRRSGSGPAT